MTPVQLAKILTGWDPVRAWRALGHGHHPADDLGRLRAVVRDTDPRAVAEQYESSGVAVHLRTSPGYPTVLRADPGAPAVLFSRGTPSALDGRARVAIVGTRSATAYGLRVASDLGRQLAEAGVAVVSGLALGIDAAAHAGALRAGQVGTAPPVAVVGTGLDVVYPKSNSSLWREVEAHGVVFTESALGTMPVPRVFPARNRIIAGLSDVVVVVECQVKGGALYTAEAAARRSIPVCAVPGSVRSPASAGTNGLLVDGCAPVRDVDDILTALALARCGKDAPHPATQSSTLVAARGQKRSHQDRSKAAGAASATKSSRAVPTTRPSGAGRRPDPAGSSGPGGVPQPLEHVELGENPRAVLAALESSPTTMDTILRRTGLSLAHAAAACDLLTRAGTVDAGPGWWAIP